MVGEFPVCSVFNLRWIVAQLGVRLGKSHPRDTSFHPEIQDNVSGSRERRAVLAAILTPRWAAVRAVFRIATVAVLPSVIPSMAFP